MRRCAAELLNHLNRYYDMTIPATISTLVSESGNNFHAKVARWFLKDGWHVIVSPYYMDQTQRKAREIDLVVEKYWPIYNFGGVRQLAVRLFVECKFVPSTTSTVFWFADKNMAEAKAVACRSVFSPKDGYCADHHYLAQGTRVAKLFASHGKGQEEPFYKALNQSLNGMVSLRGLSMSAKPVIGAKGQAGLLEFPVIVCSSFDTTFRVDFDNELTEPAKVAENFQLEIRYAYVDRNSAHREEYFFLDVVEFDLLPGLMSAIETDAKAAVELLAD